MGKTYLRYWLGNDGPFESSHTTESAAIAWREEFEAAHPSVRWEDIENIVTETAEVQDSDDLTGNADSVL